MRRPRYILLLLIPLFLAGCETINRQDRAVLRAHDVPQDVYDRMLYGDPLSLDDVIELCHRAVPPGLIVHYMDETDTAYRLRKVDVQRLRSAGVYEAVISFMLSTAPAYGPGPYPGPYPYPYGPYPYGYYYDGAYFGPIIVGGWGWGRGWGHGGGWGGGGWGHGGGHHR